MSMKQPHILSPKIVLALLGLIFSLACHAGIHVIPSELEFSSQSLKKDVLVINEGDKTAYVAVTPYIMQNPGRKSEKKVYQPDPGQSGMLVTPTRLIIPPHQQRYVRLLMIKPLDDTERIYRVNFIPQSGKLIPGPLRPKTGKPALGIHVITGYGILVTSRPGQLKPKLSVKRKGHKLTVKNIGNTSLILKGGQQCASNKKCFKLPYKRLYAGNTWLGKVPYTTPVTVKARVSTDIISYSTE